jgi:hypothetical protein
MRTLSAPEGLASAPEPKMKVAEKSTLVVRASKVQARRSNPTSTPAILETFRISYLL